MARMTHRERVYATLRRQETDRPPLTFWQHAPGRDLAAASFAPVVIHFQREYDLDIVKITPSGSYQAIDYGVKTVLARNDLGTTQIVEFPVHGPADWARLPTLPLTWGAVGEQVETVRIVREAVGDTPVLQTVFGPLTVAARLVGNSLTREIMETPEFAAALEQIADDVARTGVAMLEAGADGIFYSSQHAHPATMPRDLFDRFGDPWDRHVLTRLREAGARILVAHAHGKGAYFDAALRWPVDCISWHDRETPPRLAEGAAQTIPFAGLDQNGPALHGAPDDVANEVRQSIAATGGRLILAPGCTYPLTVPAANLKALREAVDAV
ncbi:MAG: uroporphyrinogen decarboxylase [Dehalococcoidia bacterium]|jgi:uroporphyrinogen decarboxylase|nr:MAG: uroporphyrinogen decarboxylase [Dehalococcoidia bacterium]